MPMDSLQTKMPPLCAEYSGKIGSSRQNQQEQLYAKQTASRKEKEPSFAMPGIAGRIALIIKTNTPGRVRKCAPQPSAAANQSRQPARASTRAKPPRPTAPPKAPSPTTPRSQRRGRARAHTRTHTRTTQAHAHPKRTHDHTHTRPPRHTRTQGGTSGSNTTTATRPPGRPNRQAGHDPRAQQPFSRWRARSPYEGKRKCAAPS